VLSLFAKLFTREKCLTEENTRTVCGIFSGALGIAANCLLFAAKLAIGLFTGSVSIVADAINNFTDAGGAVVTLLGFHLSGKPADREHPFGHARMEYLTELMIAALILLCGYELAKTSADKIFHPQPVSFSLWAGVILALSILVKLGLALWNRRMGHQLRSSALLAAAADSRNDMIATGAVLLSCLVEAVTQVCIDGWVGLLVALFILHSGFSLIRSTVDLLLGAAPDAELVAALTKDLCSREHVLGIHDLLVHDYGPGRRFASVHVEMEQDLDPLFSHNIIDNIERDIQRRHKLQMTIHYDPVTTEDEALNSCRALVLQLARETDPRMSLHDFRMVAGPLHTNVIFDLVVPICSPREAEAFREQLSRRIRESHPELYPVIELDSAAFNPTE